MIIPDELLIFSGVVILVLKIISSGFGIIIPTIIDMLIASAILLLIKLIGDYAFKRESMGWGDIKLMLIFGMVLGWKMSVVTIFMSAFLALPISLITIKSNKSHELTLGPYLGLAALICLICKIDFSMISQFLGF